MKSTALLICLCTLIGDRLGHAADAWAFLDNGMVCIGVKKTSGAGIGWFSVAGSLRQFINRKQTN